MKGLLKDIKIAWNEDVILKVDGILKDADFDVIMNWNYHNHANIIDLRKAALENKRLPNLAFDPDKAEHPYQSHPISEPIYFSNIEKLYLPEDLIEIGIYAFKRCNISELYMPSTIEIIDYYPFIEGSVGRGFYIPESLRSIGPYGLANIGLKEIILPEGMVELGERALEGTPEAELVLLPSTMKILKTHSLCTGWMNNNSKGISVKNLYSRALLPPECEQYVFFTEEYVEKDKKNTETTIYVPIGCAETYRNAQGWNFFENIVETDHFPQR